MCAMFGYYIRFVCCFFRGLHHDPIWSGLPLIKSIYCLRFHLFRRQSFECRIIWINWTNRFSYILTVSFSFSFALCRISCGKRCTYENTNELAINVFAKLLVFTGNWYWKYGCKWIQMNYERKTNNTHTVALLDERNAKRENLHEAVQSGNDRASICNYSFFSAAFNVCSKINCSFSFISVASSAMQ